MDTIHNVGDATKTRDVGNLGDARDDQTLATLLRSIADTRLPTQFSQLLQLAIPFAVQFWSYGLHRTAGWMVVVSLFGLWALAVKRLDGTDERDVRFTWARIGRYLTGRVGTGLAAVLTVEAVIRFMTFVFRCPGCAG
ncbi:MAG: hypothetical protein ABJF01_04180 [bacterium]